MKKIRIYSKNAEYQRLETLKTNRNKRYKHNEFIIEGVRNINEAIKNGWHMTSLIYTRDKPLSGWAEDLINVTETDINYELTEALMSGLSGKSDASELMAVVRMRSDDPALLSMPSNPLLALFDRPSNKGNLGTLIRSCDALGIDALILTGHAVDLYDIDVIVSSMGSFFSVPVIRMPENKTVEAFIVRMRAAYPGFVTVGTSAHAQADIYDVDMTVPLMLMIGNETDGLSRAFKDMCDIMASIPMSAGSSASSLNVGCAATVMFYEAIRQRKF